MEGKREAAPVLAHGKRHAKRSNYIITAKRLVCNLVFAGAAGLAFPTLLFGNIVLGVALYGLALLIGLGAKL